MIPIEKISKVVDSEEGCELFAEYVKLYLQINDPEHADDENYQQMIIAILIQQLSEKTAPNGMDEEYFIIKCLEAGIDELKGSVSTPASTPVQPSTPSVTYSSTPKRSVWQILLGAWTMIGASAGFVSTTSSGATMDAETIAAFAIVILGGLLLFINGIRKKIR